jgi:hypothetical protein
MWPRTGKLLVIKPKLCPECGKPMVERKLDFYCKNDNAVIDKTTGKSLRLTSSRTLFCPNDAYPITEGEVAAGTAAWNACKFCFPLIECMERIYAYVKQKKECSADDVYKDLGIEIVRQVGGYGLSGYHYSDKLELFKAPSQWGHDRYHWRLRVN